MKGTDNADGTTTVHRICVLCGNPSQVSLPTATWKLWDFGRGPFIQEIAPELTPGEREILISGSHDECFDKAFPPEGGDDEDFTFIGIDS